MCLIKIVTVRYVQKGPYTLSTVLQLYFFFYTAPYKLI